VPLHDTEDPIHSRPPHFPRYVMVVNGDVQWHDRRLGHWMYSRRKQRFLGRRAQQAWPGVRVTASLEAQGDRGEDGACETSHAWGVPTLAIHGTMLVEGNNDRW
jgi:hypothetical protein